MSTLPIHWNTNHVATHTIIITYTQYTRNCQLFESIIVGSFIKYTFAVQMLLWTVVFKNHWFHHSNNLCSAVWWCSLYTDGSDKRSMTNYAWTTASNWTLHIYLYKMASEFKYNVDVASSTTGNWQHPDCSHNVWNTLFCLMFMHANKYSTLSSSFQTFWISLILSRFPVACTSWVY